MNIPIYRAKKIDSDEYVEGYYYPIRIVGTDNTSPSIASQDLKDDRYDDYFEVNPSTLEISLDGENWKSMKDLEEMFTFDNEMMKINIDNGGRVTK